MSHLYLAIALGDPTEGMLRSMKNRKETGGSQQDFTHSKLSLANLVASYSGITALVDKGEVTGVLYLDFCKAFDNVLYNILIFKLKKH